MSLHHHHRRLMLQSQNNNGQPAKALDIEGLEKIYPTGVEALKGVDLEIEAGEFYGLLGPNGAGKSTLIHCTTGLAQPTGGEIQVFGHDAVADYGDGASGGRAGAAGAEPRLVSDPRGDARLPRRLLRDAEEGAPRARRRAARDLLAVRKAQGAHADALGRDEAPADPRAGADAPPAAADPRRADRRGRHRAAPRALALREADQRRGHDDPAHHSLPRGGRAALRPDRLHQRGQHRRPGLELGELSTRFGVANLEDAYLELVGRKELSRSKVEEEFV